METRRVINWIGWQVLLILRPDWPFLWKQRTSEELPRMTVGRRGENKTWRDREDKQHFRMTWVTFKIFTVAHHLPAPWWLTHHCKHLLHRTCVYWTASCEMINPNSRHLTKKKKSLALFSLTLTVLWRRDKYFHLYSYTHTTGAKMFAVISNCISLACCH